MPPVVGLSSAPGSTLTLDSTSVSFAATAGVQRRPHHPALGGSMRPSSGVVVGGASSHHLRGHFGGVTVAPDNGSHDLGECLLASHTDRTRSAVLVYPEAAWRGAIAEKAAMTENAASTANPGATSSESIRDDCLRGLGVSLLRQARRQPYALEVDPCMRRLAGLTAFPSRSLVVVVDLGGQSAYCLRYA